MLFFFKYVYGFHAMATKMSNRFKIGKYLQSALLLRYLFIYLLDLHKICGYSWLAVNLGKIWYPVRIGNRCIGSNLVVALDWLENPYLTLKPAECLGFLLFLTLTYKMWKQNISDKLDNQSDPIFTSELCPIDCQNKSLIGFVTSLVPS